MTQEESFSRIVTYEKLLANGCSLLPFVLLCGSISFTAQAVFLFLFVSTLGLHKKEKYDHENTFSVEKPVISLSDDGNYAEVFSPFPHGKDSYKVMDPQFNSVYGNSEKDISDLFFRIANSPRDEDFLGNQSDYYLSCSRDAEIQGTEKEIEHLEMSISFARG